MFFEMSADNSMLTGRCMFNKAQLSGVIDMTIKHIHALVGMLVAVGFHRREPMRFSTVVLHHKHRPHKKSSVKHHRTE